MIGIHMAIALPPTVVEIIAPTTPIDTIQLHSTPRRKMVAQPAAPYSAYPRVRASPMCESFCATSPGSVEKP